jgi:diguanylate cyclase (GGDEF)-like protein/PAS domain S-box-containing protein/putative nucleotidyltransferase with HDIG domain
VTVGVIIYNSFSGWLNSTDALINQITDQINDEIKSRIDIFLSVPEHINELHKDFIELGVIDFNNETQRDKFFATVIANHDLEVYSFSFGGEDGSYYGARRNLDNDIEIMRNDETTDNHSWYYSTDNDYTALEKVYDAGYFDPRTRVWYKEAKQENRFVFAPVYKHFVMEDLTVSAATPIVIEEEFIGVLGTHITLSKINQMLVDIIEGANIKAIVYETESGELVANSIGRPNFNEVDSVVIREKIGTLDYELVNLAFKKFQENNIREFELKYNDLEYFVSFNEYRHSGIDWTVASFIEESQYLEGVYDSLIITVLVFLIAILVAFITYMYTTNNLFKPIDDLIEIADDFSRGDLRRRAKVYQYDEVGRLTSSFNNMADTLNDLVDNLESKVSERTTELEVLNTELASSRGQLKLILDSTAEGIYGIDLDGNFAFINQSGLEILGYRDSKELIGKNSHMTIHYKDIDGQKISMEECKIMKAANNGEGIYVDDEVFWKKDGTCFYVGYNSYPQVVNNEVVGIVVTFKDITVEKENIEKIEYLSYHDALTGLYNRLYFESKLREVDKAERLPISVIVGDINGLKLTNDVLGHGAGDKLLIRVSEVFKEFQRESDIVARIGGDEFIMLLPNTKKRIAEKLAEDIRKTMNDQTIVAIKANISLGVETKTYNQENIEDVIRVAEDKMYLQKSISRQNIKRGQLENIVEAAHSKNEEERAHANFVSALSKEVGKKLGLEGSKLNQLEKAGYYHDAGKAFLDDKYARPRVKDFSEKEKEDMKQHAVIGYRILNSFDETLDIAEFALYHHELYDGTGYPRGLKGEEIPQGARILSAIEYYDALINGYIDKMYSPKEAIEIMKKELNNKVDPVIGAALIEVVTERINKQ